MKISYVGVLAAGLMVSGCGINRGPDLPASLPAPVIGADVQPDYRIGPFDVLQITVYGAPDLTGPAQVDGEGLLRLPLIEPIFVASRSPGALAEAIEQAYSARYLRDPDVSVVVTTPQSRRVVVSGQVAEPGVFPLVGQITLQEAIALAQGLGEVADPSRVIVLRTIDGQQVAARFNLNDIRNGEAVDPVLAPGDIVLVDTAQVRQLIRDIAPLGSLFNVFRRY